MQHNTTPNNEINSLPLKRMDKRVDIIIYVLLFAIPFLFFFPIFFANVNINIGDGIGYEILLVFLKKICSNGELPLWNKYVALGTSFVGDIQNKVFYPLTWISSFLPEKIAFKFFYVLHISLANLFMYLLCREMECKKNVSFLGAFIFSFSNLIIIRYEHINILCCLVWIPLIFKLLLGYYKQNNKKYLAFLALAMGMQFMAGFPQTAFYSDLFVFISMVYLNFRFKNSIKRYLQDAVKLGMFYLGICMVQILPLIEIMLFSGRETITFEYFADGAANLWQILDLLAPTATGHFGSLLPGSHEFPTDTYLGIIPATLIIFSIVYLHKNKDIIFLFAYAIFALIFSSACNNIPLLGRLIYVTPVFGSFRTTTRMLAFFVIPMMFISIIGLREIIKEKLWKQYFNVTIVIFAILLIAYIGIRIFGENSKSAVVTFYFENNVGLNSIVLLGILNVVLIVYLKMINMKKTGIVIASFMAAIFQIFDVYFYNTDKSADIWRIPNLLNAKSYEETFDSDIKDVLLKLNPDGKERYFVNFYTWEELADTSWSIRPNGNMLAELPMVQAYITFNNPELLLLTNTTYGMMMNTDELQVATNQSLIDFLNIGYIVSRGLQKPLGEYDYNGIIYEEYEGKQYADNKALLLGNIKTDSYISINIDAEVMGEGAVLSLYNGDEKILDVGTLVQGVQFYEYNYTPQTEINSLRLVFENGSNVRINGIRIESFKLSNLSSLDVVYSNEKYAIYENHKNAGHVFVFENVNTIDDVENFIVNNKETINFTKDAYLEKEKKVKSLKNCKGTILSSDETNNTLYARVEINSDEALLGFSESFYPGWKVYVDGKKQDLIKVDGLIQGVFLPKGEHEVEFRYEPASIFIGGIISLVTMILMIMYVQKENKKGDKNEYYKNGANA